MPREVHTQELILGSLLAKVIKKVDPGLAEETNSQMHGMLAGHSGGVGLAPGDEQHISRCHLDLLVWRDTCIYFDGIRLLRVPDAPLLVSVSLHDQDVHDVPMRLERAALEKAQIGIHVCVDSHLSFDGHGKLTDLRNRAVDIIHNDADALRQQVVKSADVELLALVRRVHLARDSYAIPHDLYVLVKR